MGSKYSCKVVVALVKSNIESLLRQTSKRVLNQEEQGSILTVILSLL